MTKAPKFKTTKDKAPAPRFPSCQNLGAGGPFIITDDTGRAWRMDPQEGTAEPVLFNK